MASILTVTCACADEENECGSRARQIIQQAYPEAQEQQNGQFLLEEAVIVLPTSQPHDNDPHVVVCRTWPAHPEKLLVAVPIMRQSATRGYDNEGDLEILVLDNDSLEVTRRRRIVDLMSDDAIRITKVAFDTARYRVAPEQTAFGLRISTEGASRVNPYSDTTLRLFLVDRDRLRLILDNLIVEKSGGEWDGVCRGHFSRLQRTLSMGSSTNHGVADIVVMENSRSDASTVAPDGECRYADLDSDANGDTRTLSLRYGGDGYEVPPELKRFVD